MAQEKVVFALNERGNLVPFMIKIETRDDTDYILEKEMLFLTDVEFPCDGAHGFATGLTVGVYWKTLKDAEAKAPMPGERNGNNGV